MFRNMFARMNAEAITYDHGPRHNILETNDEPIGEQIEDIPLLPQRNISRYRYAINRSNMALICGLMMLFLFAFGIGIYLLIPQNKSENNFLPINTDAYVDEPLSERQWYEAIAWKFQCSARDHDGNEYQAVVGSGRLSFCAEIYEGNFFNIPPTIEQINTATNLLRAAMEDNYLERKYIIIGKATKVMPKYLFRCFQNLHQYYFKLSDI